MLEDFPAEHGIWTLRFSQELWGHPTTPHLFSKGTLEDGFVLL